MRGPEIIVNTLTTTQISDASGHLWQYNSRSDSHSKVACWAVLFDLLVSSPTLIRQATQGKIVFGINETLRDWRTNREKNLDLVIARPTDTPWARTRERYSFVQLAELWNVTLSAEQSGLLDGLIPASRNKHSIWHNHEQ